MAKSKTYELMLKIGGKADSSLKGACAAADKNLAALGNTAKSVGKTIAGAALAGASPCSSLIHPPHVKAGYGCTQRYGPEGPMHRIAGSQSVSYAGRKYHNGSTSAHKNRSPRKQGRINHAIGKRPESASA